MAKSVGGHSHCGALLSPFVEVVWVVEIREVFREQARARANHRLLVIQPDNQGRVRAIGTSPR